MKKKLNFIALAFAMRDIIIDGGRTVWSSHQVR